MRAIDVVNGQAFWLVWNPQGGPPTYRHERFEDAENEARRLARMNRGQTFYVLQAVGEVSVDDVHVVRYGDEIPF